MYVHVSSTGHYQRGAAASGTPWPVCAMRPWATRCHVCLASQWSAATYYFLPTPLSGLLNKSVVGI